MKQQKPNSKRQSGRAQNKPPENPAKRKIKILFLCTGNTCRSPMAEQIFKDFLRKKKMLSKFEVKSAGVGAQDGDGLTPDAIDALKSLGIAPSPHTSRLVTIQMLEKTDLVLCMTQRHKSAVEPYAAGKAFALEFITGADVPDPYGMGYTHYRAAADCFVNACADILRLALKVSDTV